MTNINIRWIAILKILEDEKRVMIKGMKGKEKESFKKIIDSLEQNCNRPL